MKHLNRKPFPRHVIKTVSNDRNELICVVVGILLIVFLLAWLQNDDAEHKAVDQSYAEETRKDMVAQSEKQKRDAKWDELNAQAHTLTGVAGVK